jgi:hypothetical protein
VTGLSTFLRYLWAANAALQLLIVSLIFTRRHYRTLPLFTSYIILNLCQAALLLPVYSHFGLASPTSYHIFWITQAVAMLAQTLASTELLHRALWDYPGIWALAWRLVMVAVTIVVIYSWATADRESQWGLLTADRGYYLTFAVAMVSCLLLVRYYSISIDPVYKVLLGGFCLYSCATVLSDSLYKWLYLRKFKFLTDVWNDSEMVVFFFVLLVWTVALRLPVRVLAQSAPPDQASYDQLSPQLNARLREINDVLRRFFRREVVQP